MNWIETGGGPMLLLPSDLAGFWERARRPPQFRSVDATFRWKEGGVATDYDRACDVRDLVATIDIGPGHGWVLNDEPLPAAMVPGGIVGDPCIVRWISAESDEEVWTAIQAVRRDARWSVEKAIRNESGELLLFDSALAGDEVSETSLTIQADLEMQNDANHYE